MKAPTPCLFALALAIPLASCRFVGGVPDFSVIEDTFSPAQTDSVYVESKPRSTKQLAAATPPPAEATASSAPTIAPHSAASTTPGTYTVCQGDTLSRIARTHGVTLSNLAEANGIDPQNAIIKPGQQLQLPKAGSAPVTSTAPAATASAPKARATTASHSKATQHTVAPGETLYRIALQHGISLNELLSANNLTEAQAPSIRTGTVLTIPTAQR